jgi:uncharacterized lipoprotein YmbA
MKSHNHFGRLTLMSAVCALFAGCLLKPSTIPTRSFVLASLPAPEHSAAASGQLSLGVRVVKLPAYLLRGSMAVRQGPNEIAYLENTLWAERLDQSFERTLAANLRTLLPTDQIHVSAWQRKDVALAVYIRVEQFDVNADGGGTLIAWWRIQAPGEDKVRKSGETRLSRKGASPYTNPDAAVATLSELNAEFSRLLVQAIREAATDASAAR